MPSYAAAEQAPAMLAEISRRRAERVLQQAASRSVSIDLLGQVMAQATTNAIAEMEREITALAGGRYERSDGRRGERNGTAPGYVVVGGRKVKVARPRLVDSAGKEVPLESYAAMQDPATLDATAMRKVVVGVAQRRVNGDVAKDQPLPEGQEAYGLSRSSVSRRWIAATAETLAGEAERKLDDRRYLAVLLDGKGFGDHLLLAGVGIDEQRRKHVLGVWEGSSESAEVCKGALEDMGRRGLDVRRGVLVVIDGGPGLAAAVRQLWGDVAVVGRCQVHRRRNILDRVPKAKRRFIAAKLVAAWREPDLLLTTQALKAIAAELDEISPAAADVLSEHLAETIACQSLGLPPELIRALGSTNLIENAFSTTESICHRVCRWRGGTQARRWATMALLRAEEGFRPIASPEAMAHLAAALASVLERRAAD